MLRNFSDWMTSNELWTFIFILSFKQCFVFIFVELIIKLLVFFSYMRTKVNEVLNLWFLLNNSICVEVFTFKYDQVLFPHHIMRKPVQTVARRSYCVARMCTRNEDKLFIYFIWTVPFSSCPSSSRGYEFNQWSWGGTVWLARMPGTGINYFIQLILFISLRVSFYTMSMFLTRCE